MTYAFYMRISFDIQHILELCIRDLRTLRQLYPYLHNDQADGDLHNEQTSFDIEIYR